MIIDYHEGRVTPHSAQAAITEKRFIKVGTQRKNVVHAEADDLTIGVSLGSTRLGDTANVIRDLEAVVSSGAAITVGQFVKSDAQGRAIPVTGTDRAAGKALTAATGADEDIVVQLI